MFRQDKATLLADALLGKTTTEVHALLGDPESIASMEYRGVRWLRITYRFEECPSNLPDGGRQTWANGWRFQPSVLFRHGTCVESLARFKELGLGTLAVTPEHLRFKEGGTFP